MKRGLIAIACVMFARAVAHADAAAADAAVAQAEAYVKANNFLDAATKYREAYAADPRPELICNVGVAYVKAKDLARAHLYLSRCLEHGTFEQSFMDAVHAAMSSVDAQLRAGEFTPVEIHVDPVGATISLDGFAKDEGFVGGRVVWLPYGKHAISATLDGYKPGSVEVVAASHTATAATITLEKAPAAIEPVGVVVAPPPKRTRVIEGEQHSKLPAIIASAATAGAIVVAAVALKGGHDRADLARFAITPDVYAADRDSIDGWNRALAISGVVAVVGAGVSGFLWYRALHTESRVEIEAGEGRASLGYFTRF